MSDIGARASAAWSRALALADQGRPAAAVDACRDALRDLDLQGVPGLHAQIEMTLASNLSELGDVPSALEHLEHALQVDPSRRPAVLVARGRILLRSGNRDAVAALDEAIDALLTLPTDQATAGVGSSDLAAALLNRGFLHMSHGRLTAAMQDTEAAADAALRARRDGVVLMARHNLGYIRFLAGDLPGALEGMRHASELAGANGDLGVQLLDRARVLAAAGLTTEAVDFTGQAIDRFRADGARPDLADALLVQADLDVRRDDPGSARAHAREATGIHRRLGNDTAALASRLIECRAAAQGRAARAPTSKAASDATTAADLATRLDAAGLHEDATVAELLRLQALLDGADVRGAGEMRSIATRAERSANLDTRLLGLLLGARVDFTTGMRAAGLAQVRRGLDDLARFQARFGSQDLQSGAAVHGRELRGPRPANGRRRRLARRDTAVVGAVAGGEHPAARGSAARGPRAGGRAGRSPRGVRSGAAGGAGRAAGCGAGPTGGGVAAARALPVVDRERVGRRAAAAQSRGSAPGAGRPVRHLRAGAVPRRRARPRAGHHRAGRVLPAARRIASGRGSRQARRFRSGSAGGRPHPAHAASGGP